MTAEDGSVCSLQRVDSLHTWVPFLVKGGGGGDDLRYPEGKSKMEHSTSSLHQEKQHFCTAYSTFYAVKLNLASLQSLALLQR